MMGARCEMPVQPVSRMLAGSSARPRNVTLLGQSQVQNSLQGKPAPVFAHVVTGDPGPGSQVSPLSIMPLPQLMSGVGVTDGVGVTVTVGVGVGPHPAR